MIQYLLGIDTGGVLEDETNGRSLQQTPETYLGTSRRASYSKQATEKLHAWWLEGDWKESDERIELTKGS